MGRLIFRSVPCGAVGEPKAVPARATLSCGGGTPSVYTYMREKADMEGAIYFVNSEIVPPPSIERLTYVRT